MTTVEIPVLALAAALAVATAAFSSSLSPRARVALLLLTLVAFVLPTLRRNGWARTRTGSHLSTPRGEPA